MSHPVEPEGTYRACEKAAREEGIYRRVFIECGGPECSHSLYPHRACYELDGRAVCLHCHDIMTVTPGIVALRIREKLANWVSS